MLAVWLERKFTKTQILELYLNRVYFGSGAYGIEQAAQRYFGKHAKELSLPEAAMLAGLVKSPSRLAPTRNFDGAEQRAHIVLAAMADLHFITGASEDAALAHPPRVVAQAGNGSINYVADWVMDAINDVLGHVDEDIVVRTTIDTGVASGRRKSAHRGTGAERRQGRCEPGRAGRDDAGWRGARHDRRPRLRAKPVQPRGRAQDASLARRSSRSCI